MPKLSVIIPAVYLTDRHYILTKECIESLNNVDELILVECGEKNSDFKADIKINSLDRRTAEKAINLGLKIASGDFMAVVSNDTKVIVGNLKDLCKEGIVTSPIQNEARQNFWGGFFVIPKEVYQKIGGFSEEFENYCSDDDYIQRLKRANIEMRCIETVSIIHYGGETNKFFLTPEFIEENKKRFQKKWGISN